MNIENYMPLKQQLELAIGSNAINKTYEFPTTQSATESRDEYIERLRENASSYQFVEVEFDNKKNFVAFGVPGPIITPWGTFMLVPAEVVDGTWGKHYFLFYPNFEDMKKENELLIRISSGCYSGMVLGDTTCDCKEEFVYAQQEIIKHGSGVVVDIPGQDGRGWSMYKMAIQRIMDELKLNTIDSAKQFYQDVAIDRRSYYDFAIIMKAFGFPEEQKLVLLNNNPLKSKALEDVGFAVTDNESFNADNISEEAKANLEAKKAYWKEKTTS